ncbi:efflux RND transporter permease subunit [Pseudooceanicola sp. HF7]|uniref:efflux RND transporter permease subunit n=1 Tax=Pseudooceanicola sp. HF7 TaxID=2721560 RepID=UPI00142F83BA|nr:efflux RND transporter permease subunit [Pseudooceanicola sp. HF7]NIZ10892.1 efflux RND transporter permease subunit [Pseudooceanicola sp. HF7]
MVNFFIHRPVFAWVLAIVTMLAGAFSFTRLPVSQYPEIAPTTIRISAGYSGATADAVQNSVTSVIEDSLTGIDGLLYMVSSSRQGSASVTLTFDESVDAVDAQNEVQSKISQVEGQLPGRVQSRGVTVTRSSDAILLVGALVSKDKRFSTIELGDILDNMVTGPVQRTEGVGGINAFGSGYAMRIWLDPLALSQYQLTPKDVTDAVEAQNTTVSVGSLGDMPTTQGQQFTATITAQSQLTSAVEFEQILLKTEEDGAAVFLGDVAKVEIGQEDYGSNSFFNGSNAAGFGVNLATGANAVDTAAAVRATLDRLAPALPAGVDIEYAYDTSPFVELSIEKVYHTLIEAVVLVLLVILIFLQKWRATLIPIIAVPVVLLGTFTVLAAAGFSINTLTMFAMVLAIGLLVDDAIVVVENVERVMEEEGLGPLEATIKGMSQITGALIGIALVLSAVFLPMAFMGGSTGVIYRQFSVTIITAMVLSALVALILSPALCATMLRPAKAGGGIAPARWFNRTFDRINAGYTGSVGRLLKAPFLMLIVLLGVAIGASALYTRLPSSFLPEEDQGVMLVIVRLTEGSTTAQTQAVVEEIDDYLRNQETGAVESTFYTLGFGFGGSGQNAAMIFVKLRDFEDREGEGMGAGDLVARGNGRFYNNRAGQIFFMQPPAIPGLGNTSGFSFYLIDQAGNGLGALRDAASQLESAVAEDGRAENLRVSGDEDEAVLRINLDQQKAESFGVSMSSVNALLSIIFSGSEVNDFNMNGNLRPVIVQADAPYRMQPEDIERWYARNSAGEMVPFSSFMTVEWVSASPTLARYGGTSAMSISGSPTAGTSSGDAMAAMEELVAQIGGGFDVAWTGLSYQEQQSGNQAPYLYALSVLVVFLSLAALYESWSIPFSVMLAVPVGILGALLAAWVTGGSNDVYFKVGILTTIGLAAKNAILIVEFAKDLEEQGKGLVEATVQAARMRLRPILMTSFAFMLGVVPLATASGAGAAAQNAIGIGVLGGMAAATFIGVFMVPSFYVFVRRVTDRKARWAAS